MYKTSIQDGLHKWEFVTYSINLNNFSKKGRPKAGMAFFCVNILKFSC